VIKTNTDGLDAGDTAIKVADGEMAGYYAKPKGAVRPPVVPVAMEIFGVHEYIKDVTRRLAKLGALAVAPDYYFRKDVDLTKITDIKDLLPIVNAKPDTELLSDLDATAAWAKAQGGDTSRLGIIGFCRGGRTVWEYAGPLRRFESSRCLLRPARRSAESGLAEEPDAACVRHEAPVLRLYGAEDQGIPWRRWKPSRRRSPTTRRPPSSRSIPARRTASMPIIAPATARKQRKTAGIRCRPGSRNTAC
jgi:carboxymethylenebutenolidase